MEVIARLVQTSPDRVREMIHRFNEMGMASLDPRWAGGRPRRITIDDESFIVETARKRPAQVGAPFSHCSLRELRRWLGENRDRPVVISKERLRQILDRMRSPSSGPRPGRSPTIRTRKRSWTASRT